MREIKITRFEMHPKEDPIGWQVGFSYTSNGRMGYNDTVISLTECSGLTDEQIAKIAYIRLKPTIESWFENFDSKSPLMGSVFTESDTTPEPSIPINWHDGTKNLRVVISDAVLNSWISIASKDELMNRQTEVTMLLAYYKAHSLAVIEESGLNYLYLDEIFSEHEAILQNNGGIIESRYLDASED